MSENNVTVDPSREQGMHHLDARGLLCPLPVIRTQSRMRSLSPGERLSILASDRGVLHDIPAWSRIHGHVVLEARAEGTDYRVIIEAGHTH